MEAVVVAVAASKSFQAKAPSSQVLRVSVVVEAILMAGMSMAQMVKTGPLTAFNSKAMTPNLKSLFS